MKELVLKGPKFLRAQGVSSVVPIDQSERRRGREGDPVTVPQDIDDPLLRPDGEPPLPVTAQTTRNPSPERRGVTCERGDSGGSPWNPGSERDGRGKRSSEKSQNGRQLKYAEKGRLRVEEPGEDGSAAHGPPEGRSRTVESGPRP